MGMGILMDDKSSPMVQRNATNINQECDWGGVGVAASINAKGIGNGCSKHLHLTANLMPKTLMALVQVLL
jgi:hypothetical protein